MTRYLPRSVLMVVTAAEAETMVLADFDFKPFSFLFFLSFLELRDSGSSLWQIEIQKLIRCEKL
jgi:hypothetical protein